MTNPNYVLLAVKSPLRSAELYTYILGAKPVNTADSFVLYALSSGLKVGLWQVDDMQPAPKSSGGFELSFEVADRNAVDGLFADWGKLGLKVDQKPTDMDFGYTFVMADSDGHRLHPFAPTPR